MVSIKYALLVSVLLASTMCKISVRDGLNDVTLLRSDVADFNLNKVFDLSQAKGKLHFDANVGRAFSDGQPFAYKNLDLLGV
jgi:hypothetical protein